MPTSQEVIAACNALSARAGGPVLSDSPTAEEVQAWLEWDDKDGEYAYVSSMSDDDALANLADCAAYLVEQAQAEKTTMGMHVHLTFGWEVLEDMPAEDFTLLRTPAGRFATVHGSEPKLSILMPEGWRPWDFRSTDDMREVKACFSMELV